MSRTLPTLPDARVADVARCDRAGALVLIGGAARADGVALGAFLALARAAGGGPVVGLTTASDEPRSAARRYAAALRAAGVTGAWWPTVIDRADAESRRVAAAVREAGAVFLGGGDQFRLVSVLAGTPVGRALRDAHRRGAVVGGTSAGAAALGAMMHGYGEPEDTGEGVAPRPLTIAPGFGLLGFGAVVDTHFGERRRLTRLADVVRRHPRWVGVGVDEDTALVLRHGAGRVHGAGAVTVVRSDGAARLEVREHRAGAPVTLRPPPCAADAAAAA